MRKKELRLLEVETLLLIEEYHKDDYKIEKLKRIKSYFKDDRKYTYKSLVLHSILKFLDKWNKIRIEE